ncbi:MAG: TetR/AcrR family transcriptional regulator [Planctomycetota bacterium]
MRIAINHRPVILKTAARLFGRRSFHEVRMEDVALSVGIAKGSIYRFYRTKEQLYADVCLESVGKLTRTLRTIARTRASARSRLTTMVKGVAEHFSGQRDFFQIIQREWSGACMSKRAAFLAQRAEAVALFAGVLREGQAEGSFRHVKPKATADMLLGMIRSSVRFGDPRQSPKQMTRLILNVFLYGLLKHSTGKQKRATKKGNH